MMFNNVEDVLKTDDIAISGFEGTSMLPMLRQGRDRVVIAKCNGRLKLHEVPLYRSKENKYVLHRIIKVKPDGYVIRGDHLYNNEYNVSDDDIVGVLKAFYRGDKLVKCNSLGYRLYIWYIRLSYPLRYFWNRFAKPKLWALKQKICHK